MAKKSRKTGKQEKPTLRKYAGMILVVVVLAVLFGALFLNGQSLKSEISANSEREAELEEEIREEEARTKSIESFESYMETDEFVEEAAKNYLGLVDENDTVFINEGR